MFVPWGLTIDTGTEPAGLAGVVAVIRVALFTVNDDAATPPKLTAVAPVKSVPVMTTLSPPSVGPLLGVRAVMVGAAGAGVQVTVARRVAPPEPLQP
ncbi:hypothetical protein D3C72_1051650 [compost metagenome]